MNLSRWMLTGVASMLGSACSSSLVIGDAPIDGGASASSTTGGGASTTSSGAGGDATSSGAGGMASTTSGGGTAGGAGGAGGADGETPCTLHQAWKATSTRFEFRSVGFFEGSTGYAADRSAMSDAQRTALDGLCVLPATNSPTATDLVSYSIKITDRDGTIATYRAIQGNLRGAPEPNPTIPWIDIHSLEPFLATVHCLSAGQTRMFGDPPTEAGPPPLSSAPTIDAAATGCLNGIYVPYTCADVWLKLKVDRPGAYEVQAETCMETTAIRLLSPDGSAELAAASGTTPQCPSVSYRFEEAAVYLIDLRKTNRTGCDMQGSAGDFFLTVEPAATAAGDASTD